MQHEKTLEFELPMQHKVLAFEKKHDHMAKMLQVDEDDDELTFAFNTVVTLCDPLTQPEETDTTVMSLDCVADLIIALLYAWYVRRLRQSKLAPEDDANDDSDDSDHEHPPNDENEPELLPESIKFEVSVILFRLLRKIHVLLGADDELKLRFMPNDEKEYLKNLRQWTPPYAHEEFGYYNLYAMASASIVALWKLFTPPDTTECNLALNPYLHYFLKLWKCHTNVILLGLEIDRRIEYYNTEQQTHMETPAMVKMALKGSSSVRYVLAWILNQNPSLSGDDTPDEIELNRALQHHDIYQESLMNFVQPLARKKLNGGALLVDMRLVIIAMLILDLNYTHTSGSTYVPPDRMRVEHKRRKINQNTCFNNLGDLLIDLEYDDRFDEDIRYVCELELEDSDGEWLDVDDHDHQHHHDHDHDHDEHHDHVEHQENVKVDAAGILEPPQAPGAVRSDDMALEFDSEGRDWRDLPRGENQEYTELFMDKIDEFELLPDDQLSIHFFRTAFSLASAWELFGARPINNDNKEDLEMGQAIINTISKAILDESDGEFEPRISPDIIYRLWCSEGRVGSPDVELDPVDEELSAFERVFKYNNKLARCMMDEMLMCEGYRRVLIWYLTNSVAVSLQLIDYVFELLAGLRGDNLRNEPFLFTRQGNSLELSEVERLMLLHEFLSKSAPQLAPGAGEDSVSKKCISMICLMINQLVNKEIISLDNPKDEIHDYRLDIQGLLINWLSVPEARKIYFLLRGYPEVQLEKYDYDADAEEKLVAEYAQLTTNEIASDLAKNGDHLARIDAFGKRIEYHIKVRLGTVPVKDDLVHLQRDFDFFLRNFNTLCKVEHLAELLFDNLEYLFAADDDKDEDYEYDAFEVDEGDEDGNEQGDEEEKEFFDAEFSSEFLDGGINKTASSKKKKKKKKKKDKKK